ncbi:MAG: zinc ribbon domain-containing protein [Treponema sp.]|nr:zinc ribbon domain-containing protein [Treponema sp.]
MRCVKCGAQLPDGNKFCPSCYSDLEPSNTSYEPPKVDPKYKSESIGMPAQKEKNIEKSIDDYINKKDEEIRKRNIDDYNKKIELQNHNPDFNDAMNDYDPTYGCGYSQTAHAEKLGKENSQVYYCNKCGKRLENKSLFCSSCREKPKEDRPAYYLHHEKNNLKQRNGFVSFWLILMLIGNISVIIYQLSDTNNLFNDTMKSLGLTNDLSITISNIKTIVYIISVILLLNWKIIGFWLIIGIDIISVFVMSRTGSGIVLFLLLYAIADIFLFGILNIRKNGISTWDHLNASDSEQQSTYQVNISNKWVWILAVFPLTYIFFDIIDESTKINYNAIIYSINTFFVVLDFGELRKKGIKTGKWAWSGALLVPVYLFIRGNKVSKKYSYAITWCATFVFYLALYSIFFPHA